MEVTRELVHPIPSHSSPQGSEPTQLGGVLLKSALIARSATAANCEMV